MHRPGLLAGPGRCLSDLGQNSPASPSNRVHVRDSTASFFAALNLENAAPAELTLQADGDLIITGTNTPDYVFEPDYPLLPLAELRELIAREGHLPNVPSDAEVKRTRQINLSEFQLRLLEKIEELTLCTLDQDEYIQQIREAVAAKEETLGALEERLGRLESVVSLER